MWSLLMGNTNSSDESEYDNSEEKTNLANKSDAYANVSIPEVNEAPLDDRNLVATERTKLNVVKIGSFHQPLKVTKIQNMNGSIMEAVHSPENGIRPTRNSSRAREALPGEDINLFKYDMIM